MAIKIVCSCSTTILAPEDKIGQIGQCPNCLSPIVVPSPLKIHRKKHPIRSFFRFVFKTIFIILISIEIFTLLHMSPMIANDFDAFLDQTRMAQEEIISHPYEALSGAYKTIMDNMEDRINEVQIQFQEFKNSIKKNYSNSNNKRIKKLKSNSKNEKINDKNIQKETHSKNSPKNK